MPQTANEPAQRKASKKVHNNGNKKKRPREEGEPRRPVSSYLLFANERRASAKEPGMIPVDVVRKLGLLWRNLPLSERAVYEEKAKEDSERYKQEMSAWKATLAADTSSDKADSSSNKVSIDIDDFKCPVCFEIPEACVACPYGHLLCISCKEKLPRPVCPTCRCSLNGATKQTGMEKILQHLPRECPFGCGHKAANLLAMNEHKKTCASNPARHFKCTSCDMSFATKEQLQTHMIEPSDRICHCVTGNGSLTSKLNWTNRHGQSASGLANFIRVSQPGFFSTMVQNGDKSVVMRAYLNQHQHSYTIDNYLHSGFVFVAKEIRKFDEPSAKLRISIKSTTTEEQLVTVITDLTPWDETWVAAKQDVGAIFFPCRRIVNMGDLQVKCEIIG